MHAGDDHHLSGFPGRLETLSEGVDDGIASDGNDGRHVQHAAYLGTPAPDDPLAPLFAAVIGALRASKARQRSAAEADFFACSPVAESETTSVRTSSVFVQQVIVVWVIADAISEPFTDNNVLGSIEFDGSGEAVAKDAIHVFVRWTFADERDEYRVGAQVWKGYDFCFRLDPRSRCACERVAPGLVANES